MEPVGRVHLMATTLTTPTVAQQALSQWVSPSSLSHQPSSRSVLVSTLWRRQYTQCPQASTRLQVPSTRPRHRFHTRWPSPMSQRRTGTRTMDPRLTFTTASSLRTTAPLLPTSHCNKNSCLSGSAVWDAYLTQHWFLQSTMCYCFLSNIYRWCLGKTCF